MFAYRLAAKLGVADVSDFNELTDAKWLEWKAVAVIDGWFNGWQKTGEIIAALNNQTNRLVAMQCKEPRSASQQMTWLSGYKVAKDMQTFGKAAPTAMTPKQAQQILKAMQ